MRAYRPNRRPAGTLTGSRATKRPRGPADEPDTPLAVRHDAGGLRGHSRSRTHHVLARAAGLAGDALPALQAVVTDPHRPGLLRGPRAAWAYRRHSGRLARL